MTKIRVLVVDDSVVIRRLLTEILAQDPAIEVVGTAPNGRIALAKLPQLCPDIITLDIEMPDMDGLETLPHLRKDYPTLPVIMFSTLTERGAVATIDALSRGATDYVAKPANVGSVSAGMQSIKDQLIPKIKSLCPQKIHVPTVHEAVASATIPAKPRLSPRVDQRCEVILIGCSTGGPTALATLLKELPANLPVGVLVVQHMPPIFTRHLAARLNQDCAVEVAEAAGGEKVQPGRVLIAPGDFHLEVRRQALVVKTVVQQGPPENSCRPAVDVLFRSAAEAYGSGCVAAVLTGMGQDGLRGAREIAAAGGTVIAQDQASCVVWGMPRAVTEAGLAHRVLPLKSIAAELVRLATDRSRKLVTC